ncbi:M23 family metallopeptidase [Paenibacillus agri]|uniref:M23 family metallopeptidase n=1 Tax=Paenibacillus agri TaxID=2744309 RepID=UPI0024845FBF|nr:M23 family metallopeptidase [Paenibacillus agri]
MKSQPDKSGITLLVVRDAGRPVRQLQLSRPMALALPAAAALSISSLVTSMHFHASKSIAELEAEAAALSLNNLRMEMQVADKDQTLLHLRSQVAELSEEAENIRDRLKNVSELEKQLQSLLDKEKTTPAGAPSAAASGSRSGMNKDNSVASNANSSSAATASKGSSASAAVNLSSASKATANSVSKTAGSRQEDSSTTTASSVIFVPEPANSPASTAIRFRIGAMSGIIGDTVTPQVGGEYIAVHQNDPFQLIEDTKDDFEEIHSILDEMLGRISNTIHQAKEASTQAAQKQAKQVEAQKQKLDSGVTWPTLSKVISSNFGYRSDPFKSVSAFHSGIDIAAKTGDPVFAALSGEVVAVDQQSARGKYIVVKHPNGLETWYMHLSGMNVSPGEKVAKGQKIGLVGSTGRSTGPHLHFQVVKQNSPVNPLTYVKP